MIQEKDFSTTFQMDFSIADRFGVSAVKDTYKRCMADWKNQYQYLTDLVCVLNHKCWEHYWAGHTRLSELYGSLYYEAYDYAIDNLKGDELRYFLEVTD